MHDRWACARSTQSSYQTSMHTNNLLWARQSCSLLDFGNKPIIKRLASDLEDQTKWLALIDKKRPFRLFTAGSAG